MSLVTDRHEVLEVYAAAAARGWVVPAFNSENRTTTEAVLAAGRAFAERAGIDGLPVCLAITNNYAHRRQSVLYTHTRDWRTGLRLFVNDVKTLTGAGAPFAGLTVLLHLDHIQWDADRELLAAGLSDFSSIMFDASTLPIDENIARTAAFVERRGDSIVIEGAGDEIVDAAGSEVSHLTTPELADRYLRETGVDLIVANLGTEHRASAATLRYRGDLAREIRDRVGGRLVLHGTSSVDPGKVRDLFADGIRKVNIWTTLERDSAPALLADMTRNAAKVAGPETAGALLKEGVLGPAADTSSAPSLAHFTTTHRQQIVFDEMVRIVTGYFDMWYR